MRLSVVLPSLLALAVGTVAHAENAAERAPIVDKSTMVRSLVKRFQDTPYQKPQRRIHAYQTWGGGRNFVTMVDDDGDFENGNWSSDSALERRLTNVLDKYYETQEDVAQFVVFFSAFQVGFPGAFYLPLANDIRGIGYKHGGFGPEVYDTTQSSPLDGIVVMNDYTMWGSVEDLSVVFNQEVGHRWGAFVHFQKEGETTSSDILLGRDLSHWSYFFNTGGSPMEGNGWVLNNDSTFTSTSRTSTSKYTNLDLYLMGLIGAEEVGEMWYVDNPDLSRLGSRARFTTRESGPSYDRPVTIGGTKTAVTIEDIIRAEGQRVPSVARAPKKFKIGFVLMVRKGQQTNGTLLEEFDGVLDTMVDKWKLATGNRGSLEVVSSGPPAPMPKPLGDACEGVFECDTVSASACIAPKVTTESGKYCARRCSADNPCGEGFCCAPANLIGDPRYCFKSDLGFCPAAPVIDAGTTVDPVADAGTTTTPPPPGGGCAAGGGDAAGFLAALLAGLAFIAVRRKKT